MCFFDQYVHQCGDYKWGSFRQHCAKEYRTGETCGMKLVMLSYQQPGNCKICDKINTKWNRRIKEVERIKRWEHEGGKSRKASIEAAHDNISQLDREINSLQKQRQERQYRLN